ncbi:MAG: hypothetical protein HOD92_19065 [Deltaproteobacteria bacterium]|jgi:hypothetical protein|nr:hypothetical protein [Deltaproteobacteria bacterium]
MQVQVKLFGTLGSRRGGYNHDEGLIIELAEGANVDDLVKTLSLENSRIGMICVDNQKINPEQTLTAGAMVSVYQPICGG